MAKAKKAAKPIQHVDPVAKAYWDQQISVVGETAFFVDTCAILACFVERDERLRAFIETEVFDYKLVTSSYHIAEAARRLVKPRRFDPFRGPSGETEASLVEHIISPWLADNNFTVLHLIEPVYAEGVALFHKYKHIKGWDLVDAISLAVVYNLGMNRIVSADQGFLRTDIMLAPSDAFARYKNTTWMYD